MDALLKQGMGVEFDIPGSVKGIGQIVGVALGGQPLLGRYYIVEPTHPISNSTYDYTHFCVYESYLRVYRQRYFYDNVNQTWSSGADYWDKYEGFQTCKELIDGVRFARVSEYTLPYIETMKKTTIPGQWIFNANADREWEFQERDDIRSWVPKLTK